MKLADFLTLAQQASRSVGQGVTGLVDLSTLATNAALRPFGRSIPVEQVPFSTAWAEGKGLLAPADYSPAGIAGQTLGGLLGPIGAAKAPQIAAGAIQAQRNLNAPSTLRRQGERGIFMGDLSKTWDKSAAAKAEAMEKAGADPRAIWQETGTFRGVDGKWRQEIDDSKSRLRKAFKSDAGEEAINLDDALTHPELFAAYPDAATMGARHMDFGPAKLRTFGGYSSARDAAVMNSGHPMFKNAGVLRGGLLHEVQHGIQKRQGMAFGGKQVNLDDYRRLAGEAEARAVQARMNMTPAQRRATFPLDSYDVPLSELIVR